MHVYMRPRKTSNSLKWLKTSPETNRLQLKTEGVGGRESARGGPQEKHSEQGSGGYADLSRCLLH